MSYTEIYKFNKNGDAKFIGETRNSHRGAMAIWRSLHSKYYNKTMDFFDLSPVWELVHNSQLSEIDKVCLISTFDGVVIYKKDIPKLTECFNAFEFDTSLKEQAELIEESLKEDVDLIAIGFNQTSINRDNWVNYGGFCEEKEEYKPYNILKDTNIHWDMFKKYFPIAL